MVRCTHPRGLGPAPARQAPVLWRARDVRPSPSRLLPPDANCAAASTYMYFVSRTSTTVADYPICILPARSPRRSYVHVSYPRSRSMYLASRLRPGACTSLKMVSGERVHPTAGTAVFPFQVVLSGDAETRRDARTWAPSGRLRVARFSCSAAVPRLLLCERDLRRAKIEQIRRVSEIWRGQRR